MTLEKREKIYIIIGTFFIVFYIFYQFIISPLNNKLHTLEIQINNKEKDLLKIMELKAEYSDIILKKKKLYEQLNEKQEDFAIFSYLEKLASESQIKEKISQMRPLSGKGDKSYKVDTIEVKLEEVQLSNLISFLYNIEHKNKSIKITQIHIRPKEMNSSFLDVDFLVSSFYIKNKK